MCITLVKYFLKKLRAYDIYARVVDVSKITGVGAANKWDFWYKNNECLNTAQSTFHVVLCLLYRHWDNRPLASLLFQIFPKSKNAKICSNTLQSDKENKIILVLTRGNHWLRICVCHSWITYGNKIESKGVQFPRLGVPDIINRGG